ncbi:TenA family transcriptional regulator [Paracoccus sp. M683]|uniref:TenA family protein n=1 Tax=Paracoccus sp. M683 TaxID=2594268 RepID=UPI00117E7612|nr:TenA family protein [Paracoccus sp. M683]TRW95310.1 TenA family transcriptional regulator [Paracoccus sp. M683]
MADRLTDRILAENDAVFQAMVNHRFVQDIAADRLPDAVFDRYLLIEGAFVETAIAIFAYAVARTDDMGDRRRLIASLDALANEQMPYFEAAFARRAIAPDPALQALPKVAGFRQGMLTIAREGSFAQIITAMFAAEWMYWTWCSAVQNAPLTDPMLRDWIALHADPDFGAQAEWLRDRLDKLGQQMTPDEQAAASKIFAQVQRLEIGFHDGAYPGGL